MMDTVAKYNHTMQDALVDEFVASKVNRDGATLAEIGIRAGYAATGAEAQVSKLLTKDNIKNAIQAKLAMLQQKADWGLARSLREGIAQYERLRDGTAQEKAIAFKWAEKNDRILGLLVERKLSATVRLPINRKPYAKTSLDELHQDLLDRLKVGSEGIIDTLGATGEGFPGSETEPKLNTGLESLPEKGP